MLNKFLFPLGEPVPPIHNGLFDLFGPLPKFSQTLFVGVAQGKAPIFGKTNRILIALVRIQRNFDEYAN